MLVLSRDCDTAIRIEPDITIKVLAIHKHRVKLGIDAPSNVRIWREELEGLYAKPEALATNGQFTATLCTREPVASL